MTSVRFALLLAGGLSIGAGNATAETADCRAQLKRQDEQCQLLAEKLATACPSGTNIKETAQCRELSSQIASTCTRKPCAPPPRKSRKAKSKKGGMGERSKPAKKTSIKTAPK
jgi:hypothetical protein